MKKISIIDYGCANYNSIKNTLKKFDCEVSITTNLKTLKKQDIIILPGVGTFPRAMKVLNDKKLIKFIKNAPNEGKKILGICLGMQLLTRFSSEIKNTNGLSLINAKTKELSYKSPNIGWSKLQIKDKKSAFAELNNQEFYFQHSYKIELDKNNYNLGFSFVREKIVSFLEFKKGITATQFHPEKSQKAGLDFFRIYLND